VSPRVSPRVSTAPIRATTCPAPARDCRPTGARTHRA